MGKHTPAEQWAAQQPSRAGTVSDMGAAEASLLCIRERGEQVSR